MNEKIKEKERKEIEMICRVCNRKLAGDYEAGYDPKCPFAEKSIKLLG